MIAPRALFPNMANFTKTHFNLLKESALCNPFHCLGVRAEGRHEIKETETATPRQNYYTTSWVIPAVMKPAHAGFSALS